MITHHLFTDPELLTDEQIESCLAELDKLTEWASALRDYATQKAVEGKKWRGWLLVEGRTRRRYTDENAAAAAVSALGFNPYEQKILGIPAMEKMLGRPLFNTTLGGLIEKPKGKPTLIPDISYKEA